MKGKKMAITATSYKLKGNLLVFFGVRGGVSMFTTDDLARQVKNIETFGSGKKKLPRFELRHGRITLTLVDNLGLATSWELLAIAEEIGIEIPDHLTNHLFPPVPLAA